MSVASRSTLVVHGRLAIRDRRLAAARDGRHGLQVMSFEQAAVRLAGGFARPIDDESLRAAIQAVLPTTPMGELESIKSLPGMIDAAADTLHKAWRAGIDLAGCAADHPRLDAIARLETAVLDQLPPGMMRPVDIVAAATSRIAHAPAVIGPMEIVGLTELSPCWRPLLKVLTAHIPVQWTAGPRTVPAWLEDTGVSISRAPAESPPLGAVSAATAYHEAIEAMRWVRSLLASGVAPSEIAIATASPAEYDDHFLALRADANIDLHFVHGVRTVTAREGQAAAALADIVVRGLSQSRLRRLAALCRDSAPFETLPEGWLRVLPADAPLSTSSAWNRLLTRLKPEDWPDGADHAQALRAAAELLAKGPGAAPEIGEAFLKGRALSIWRKALLSGPAASIDATLETLKQDDGLEACVSVAWMPASALAASPRRFVRLLGLNSSRWPRGIAEDRLIPDHIIPTAKLDPLPVSLADRRDFETILATTSGEVVLSRARRDSDGRLLGRSPLLAGHGEETYLRRNAVPGHAFSETDRLMARPQEFAADPQAVSAQSCWRDWRRAEITAHDGLIRADHPLVLAILDRTQSASSLRRLLRNPLSFVWVYAFGWRVPQSSAEPLVLDALGVGDLVHMVLDRALRDLEGAGGLASANAITIEAAVRRAAESVAADWESERPIPPAVIWGRTLDDARLMAGRALSYGDDLLPDARSYGEVPFGGSEPKSDAEMPWDPGVPVTIPDTGFDIAGYIDRLDISGDGKRALVRDYKTGRPPRGDVRLNGGRELQRCLYAFAVKALLGDDVTISASLLYPREPVDLQLDDPEAVLAEITGFLRAARVSFAGGAALPGLDTGGDYDDLAFALPANASATYCKRKLPAATERLGEVARVWEVE
ncbi:MAG: PD-(D/E)XK nuclease family protein [Roseitalea sp.]|nr:PD-(D/E)XK nuclease family protein [Roseitalea sp.]MBO6951439.1 PD-(D/E)XK nuclease family protein [Rhizobiaceae bacterium]MBO6592714.1 PD-(D/E)XK nuclease family protein [Roseitalea sp.]MBO6598969.1 PD-(D/E)XK nuclease family protein [Roseitalea sp.]MBO6611416.1 PD-(D/E)XK nuclease family protein [Roseitalea sp.]